MTSHAKLNYEFKDTQQSWGNELVKIVTVHEDC